jgi:hypothetical protein
MAFGAAAQATTGAKWLILTSTGVLKEAASLPAIIELEKDSPSLIIHAEILKIKVLLLCTELKAVNAKLLANGSVGKEPGVVSGSQLLFSGCSVDLNGTPAPECTPKDKVDGEGTVVSNLLHALLELGAGGVDLIKVIPDTGETFGTQELPAACPIGTKIPLIGKLTFKDCENLALTHLVKHLLEAGPGTELWMISRTEEHKATLLGSAWAKLGAEHTGLKFSADPA